MPVPHIYKGFSTIGAEQTRDWSVTDINCIKRDMLNQFATAMGERLMRPDFGCRIWDWLDDQMDDVLRQKIVQEAIRVVKCEPRVNYISVNLFEYDNGIRIEIMVEYIGMGVYDTMTANFEREQAAIYSDLIAV